MLTRQCTKKMKSQKGATLVEFALLATVFFVILLGFLEFGFLFLQTHFVANAAREGVRVGIVANSYECFETAVGGTPCTVKRQEEVELSVRDYLSALYADDDIQDVLVTSASVTDPRVKKILSVTVTVDNFMPVLLTGLVELLDPDSTADYPFIGTISYTAEGEYEDPVEDPDI